MHVLLDVTYKSCTHSVLLSDLVLSPEKGADICKCGRSLTLFSILCLKPAVNKKGTVSENIPPCSVLTPVFVYAFYLGNF